jgi:hypothetical protein
MRRLVLLLLSALALSCVDREYNPYYDQTRALQTELGPDSSVPDSHDGIRLAAGSTLFAADSDFNLVYFYFRCAAGDSFRLKIFTSHYRRWSSPHCGYYYYDSLVFRSNSVSPSYAGIPCSLKIDGVAYLDSIGFWIYREQYARYTIELSFDQNHWDTYQDDTLGGKNYLAANLINTGATDSLIIKTPDWYRIPVSKNVFLLASVRLPLCDNYNGFLLSLYDQNSGPELSLTNSNDVYFFSSRDQEVRLRACYAGVFRAGYLPVYYGLRITALDCPDSVVNGDTYGYLTLMQPGSLVRQFVRYEKDYRFIATDSGAYRLTYSDPSNRGLANLILYHPVPETTFIAYCPFSWTKKIILNRGDTADFAVSKSHSIPTPFELDLEPDSIPGL